MINKLLIKGSVLCKCGGQIISNSGKVIMNKEGKIQCWECKNMYIADEVYHQRIEGKHITFQ